MILIILQWNAMSLIANGQEFKKFVFDLPDKPYVICVQETWLKPLLDFVIPRYSAEMIGKQEKMEGWQSS